MTDKVQTIRKEIERLARSYQDASFRTIKGDTANDFADKILSFIDSLQDKPKTDPYGNDEAEMNSLAYLEQLGYTCIPPSCERNKRDKDMTREEAIDVLTRLANGTPEEGVFFSVREAAKVAIEALSTPELTAELEEEVIKFWNDNALAYRAGHIADLTFLRFAAQHFSKWQKQQDFKDLLKSDNTNLVKCYEKGKEDQKAEDEQKCQGCFDRDGVFWKGMQHTKEEWMKEAVDGFIFQSEEYYPKEVIGRYDGKLKRGDKVKLIIIKVDEGI